MSLVSNIENVALSSEYATDKIVAVYSGSFNASTAPTLSVSIVYKEIPHPFGRPVFTKTQVSKDNVIWSDENSFNPYDSSSTLGISYSTSSSVFVLYNNPTGPPSGTIYYRVIAFWIDDYDASNPLVEPTTGSSSSLFFDSRVNYQKIYDSDVITNPAATSTTLSVNHTLGYQPNVRAFCEMLPGQVWPAVFGGTKDFWLYNLDMVECELKVYTDKVDFVTSASISSPASRIWYVIYYDE